MSIYACQVYVHDDRGIKHAVQCNKPAIRMQTCKLALYTWASQSACQLVHAAAGGLAPEKLDLTTELSVLYMQIVRRAPAAGTDGVLGEGQARKASGRGVEEFAQAGLPRGGHQSVTGRSTHWAALAVESAR